MDYQKLNKNKGVAGLNIYLSLIAMLFMIGIIVMVFQIAGSKLIESARDVTTATKSGESGAYLNQTGYTLADSLTALNFRSPSVVALYNGTTLLLAGNYSLTGNVLKNATTTTYGSVSVNYTYVYDANNEATASINETKGAIAESTGFFGTFIVLGAMVVLILLVVIIINSIRATGITEGA
jgi:uncharacterized membrane protein